MDTKLIIANYKSQYLSTCLKVNAESDYLGLESLAVVANREQKASRHVLNESMSSCMDGYICIICYLSFSFDY